MEIRSLEGLSLETLSAAFNEAFADYLIPFPMTPEELAFRMRICSMRLEWSVGCFDQDRLVGFIWSGYRQTDRGLTLYNAGTGVVPAYRGQRLTAQMYAWLTPRAQAAGVQHMVLEVIKENEKALRAYQGIGFHINRGLGYWRGPRPAAGPAPHGLDIRPLDTVPWPEVTPWWSIQPAWPSQIQALNESWDDFTRLGAFLNGQLAGYTVFLPRAGRMYHLCVKPELRRRGIGRALMEAAFSQITPELLAVANVDESDEACRLFLARQGIEHTTSQWEMWRTVKSEPLRDRVAERAGINKAGL